MEQAKNKRNDNWRNEEADFNEVLKNNPEIPRLELLKIDIQRRGVYYTDAALKLVDPQVHQTDMRYMFTAKEKDNKPVSITFRDGNSITNLGDQPLDYGYREPYIIDTVDGKPAVVDQDEVIEYVKYWTKPDYYNKKTSNGTPMWQVVNARPQRLDVMPNDQCHFWDKPGGGCKYCWAAGGYNKFEQDHLNCRFKLEFLEFLESSDTNRNLIHSLWFDHNISVLLIDKEGQTLEIRGIPETAIIEGAYFQEKYVEVQNRHGGKLDLATIWVVNVTEIRDKDAYRRAEKEREDYPIIGHLDRWAK